MLSMYIHNSDYLLWIFSKDETVNKTIVCIGTPFV